MTDMQIMSAGSALIGLLVAILVAMLGWIGTRIIVRLDLMVDRLNKVSGELHTRINGLDTRLTRVETKVEG